MKSRMDRFSEKYFVDEMSGCWLWTGAKLRRGYGSFYIPGVTTKAHRASWILHVGPIPDGAFVCHHCDTPSCVNPAHLFVGSHQDNVADRDLKGRQARHAGERNGQAKLTDAEADEIRVATGSQDAIAARYGIRQSSVSRIKSGVRRRL